MEPLRVVWLTENGRLKSWSPDGLTRVTNYGPDLATEGGRLRSLWVVSSGTYLVAGEEQTWLLRNGSRQPVQSDGGKVADQYYADPTIFLLRRHLSDRKCEYTIARLVPGPRLALMEEPVQHGCGGAHFLPGEPDLEHAAVRAAHPTGYRTLAGEPLDRGTQPKLKGVPRIPKYMPFPMMQSAGYLEIRRVHNRHIIDRITMETPDFAAEVLAYDALGVFIGIKRDQQQELWWYPFAGSPRRISSGGLGEVLLLPAIIDSYGLWSSWDRTVGASLRPMLGQDLIRYVLAAAWPVPS